MARDPLLWLCAEMRVLGKRIMALEHKCVEPKDFKWNPQAPEFVPQTQTVNNEYLAKQLMELLKEVPQVQMPVPVQNPIPVPLPPVAPPVVRRVHFHDDVPDKKTNKIEKNLK